MPFLGWLKKKIWSVRKRTQGYDFARMIMMMGKRLLDIKRVAQIFFNSKSRHSDCGHQGYKGFAGFCSYLCSALVCLVDEDLRHPLDGDGERDHRVVGGAAQQLLLLLLRAAPGRCCCRRRGSHAAAAAAADVGDGCVGGGGGGGVGRAVEAASAEGAEHGITGLAKQKFLK